jgi:hypothetical protein
MWTVCRFLGDYMSSAPTADEQEHRRLSNALEHLKRSNRELAEALEDGPDPIYEEAIQENTEVSNIESVRCKSEVVQLPGVQELANLSTLTEVAKDQRDLSLCTAFVMPGNRTYDATAGDNRETDRGAAAAAEKLKGAPSAPFTHTAVVFIPKLLVVCVYSQITMGFVFGFQLVVNRCSLENEQFKE